MKLHFGSRQILRKGFRSTERIRVLISFDKLQRLSVNRLDRGNNGSALGLLQELPQVRRALTLSRPDNRSSAVLEVERYVKPWRAVLCRNKLESQRPGLCTRTI